MNIQHTNNDSHMFCSYTCQCLEFFPTFFQKQEARLFFLLRPNPYSLGVGTSRRGGRSPQGGITLFHFLCTSQMWWKSLIAAVAFTRSLVQSSACLLLAGSTVLSDFFKFNIFNRLYLFGLLLLPTKKLFVQQCRALDPEWSQEIWQTTFQLLVTQSIVL